MLGASDFRFVRVRRDYIEFHFCPVCGCLVFWRGQRQDPQGRRRIAVNVRLAEPDAVARIPIDHFDRLDTFKDLPRDGRCVADYGSEIRIDQRVRDSARRSAMRAPADRSVN